jgi:hypothetical protein
LWKERNRRIFDNKHQSTSSFPASRSDFLPLHGSGCYPLLGVASVLCLGASDMFLDPFVASSCSWDVLALHPVALCVCWPAEVCLGGALLLFPFAFFLCILSGPVVGFSSTLVSLFCFGSTAASAAPVRPTLCFRPRFCNLVCNLLLSLNE